MIRHFLDVSSRHLSPNTWIWLDAQFADDAVRNPHNTIAAQLAGGRTRYGWFVYAPEDPALDLTPDLARVLAEARKQGPEYELFDCDARPNQDLPVLYPDAPDGAWQRRPHGQPFADSTFNMSACHRGPSRSAHAMMSDTRLFA